MAEAPELNHETRDIPVRVPVVVAAITVILVPVCAVLLWLYFSAAQEPPSISPAFGDLSERAATAPPLMPNPALAVPESIRRMEARLRSYGWVDRDAGIVHIPIERAMQRLVERGLSGDLFPVASDTEAGKDAGRAAEDTLGSGGSKSLDSRFRGNDGGETHRNGGKAAEAARESRS